MMHHKTVQSMQMRYYLAIRLYRWCARRSVRVITIVVTQHGHCDAKQRRTVMVGLYEIEILCLLGAFACRAPIPCVAQPGVLN